tara:strand:- start:1010 stop:1573 length:564 start_codon:yes stop_codon:yes gene_type:complete
MKLKKHIKKIIFILLIYLIYVNFFKGYFSYLPTIPIYPNNEKDLEQMKNIMKTRTEEDVDYFFKTNQNVIPVFLPHVNESLNELTKIVISQNHIITFFKRIINRRRPYQIDTELKPLSTATSQTPAYPAGHAYQALLLASHLSKKYPEKKELFDNIAARCDDCRVKAGIHYKSDGEFSKRLFQLFNN